MQAAVFQDPHDIRHTDVDPTGTAHSIHMIELSYKKLSAFCPITPAK